MTQTYSLFRSRTFWTLVAMSLIPVFSAIVQTLPQGWEATGEVILGIIASYFHKDGMVSNGATN